MFDDNDPNSNSGACKPCRKDRVRVDISKSTLQWNNMVENAAKRIREEKKKKVSFGPGTKTIDGKGKMLRRSERLRAKNKNLVMDDERFVRRIRAKGPMTWGWFTYIPEGKGGGHWYKNTSEDSAVAA